MSIEILSEKCIGCGACARVCPGGLLQTGAQGAYIEHPERCWGCASCLKACPAGAIEMFLGADIGGLGGRLSVCRSRIGLDWRIRKPDGTMRVIATDPSQANKY